MTSERRVVTVLFSDLSGFTSLSEHMDPEELRDLIDALFHRFRSVIESHGGSVDKFIGDAVMAVFGAPVAHEDDPLRAVRVGLAMQQEIAKFNAERKLELRLRIGINTGEVLWGSIGGAPPTAMGDAVNVAQRLEGAATPGSVLISRATLAGTGRHIRVAGRESLQVRGRQDPVEVFEALDDLGGQTEFRVASAGAVVGRDAELDRLVSLFESRKGAFVFLQGEAGIGKTRLLAELRRRVRALPGDPWVAVGRSLENLRLPLGPFADVVRTECGVAGLDPADAPRVVACLERDLPAPHHAHLIALSIGYLLPDSEVRHIEPERLPEETLLAWSAWLESRASRRPVLLCLEDFHWADPLTRAFLADLAPRLRNSHLLAVVSSRPSPAPPPGFDLLPLRELPEDASRALASSALGSPPSPELQRFLVDQSGGNPYYLEELVRFLREENLIEGSPARMRAAPGRIPANLQGLLVARLDHLAPEVKDTLKCASVVGRSFWRGFVSELLGRDVSADFEEARRRDLIFAQPASLLAEDSQFAFRHALLRDAALSLLTKKDRARHHAGAADRLEALASARDRRLLALAASHRQAAGQVPEAVALWLTAVERALPDFAEEAVAWAAEAHALRPDATTGLALARARMATGRLDPALAAAEAAGAAAGPDQDRRDARLLVAEIRNFKGPFDEALRVADGVLADSPVGRARTRALLARVQALTSLFRHAEALALLEEVDRAAAAEPEGPERQEMLIKILITRAAIHQRTDEFPASLATFQRALDLGGPSLHARRRGLILNGMANAQFRLGKTVESLALQRQAEELYRQCGDRRGLAACLGNIGYSLRVLGRFEEALVAQREALAIYEETGDRTGMATSLGVLGHTHMAMGDYARGGEAHRRTLEIRRELGDRAGVAGALNNIAMVQEHLGEFPAALRHYREALDIHRQFGNRLGSARVLNNIGLVHQSLGEYQAAADCYDQSLALSREIGNVDAAATALLNHSKISILQGDYARAEEQLREATEQFRSLQDLEGHAECLEEQARVHLRRGELPAAMEKARSAVEMYRGIKSRPGLTHALNTLGSACLENGNAEEALAAHREALDVSRETGDPVATAAALQAVSRVHLFRADFQAAREAAEEALGFSRRSAHLSGTADGLFNLGQVLAFAGNGRLALESHGEALELRRRSGIRPAMMDSLVAMGRLETLLGVEAAAEQHMAEAEALAVQLGTERAKADAMSGRVVRLLYQGDMERAARMAGESMEIYRKTGFRSGEAVMASNAAMAAAHLCRWDEADRLNGIALASHRALGDLRSVAGVLINRANIQLERGRPREALSGYEEAIGLCAKIGAVRSHALALRGAGLAHGILGDFAAAHAAHEDSFHRYMGLSMPGHAGGTLQYRSRIAHLQGLEAEVVRLLGEALNLAGGQEALFAREMVSADQAIPPAVLELLRRRGLLADEGLSPMGRFNRALAEVAMDRENARRLLENARRHWPAEPGVPSSLWRLGQEARLLEGLGDGAASRKCLEEGLALSKRWELPGFVEMFERLLRA